ncbi:MAG: carotenoid 1,2-hydratase [Nitrospiraceae bacterium]
MWNRIERTKRASSSVARSLPSWSALIWLAANLVVPAAPAFSSSSSSSSAEHRSRPEPATAKSSSFQQALPGYRYLFPRDHGSHPAFQTEWWYYTGHLQTADGRQFGYELTFFRRGVNRPEKAGEGSNTAKKPSRWRIYDLYLAHFALTDLTKEQFHYAEKISREGLGKAGADQDRLRVWIDRWSAVSPMKSDGFAAGSANGLSKESDAPDGTHHLTAATETYGIELALSPAKPPVIHGSQGISRKGDKPGEASHYYSLTRLSTKGAVTIDGERIPVTGQSWMDHEFGSSELGSELVGWDWFSLQLDTGDDLMWYRLRRQDGRADPASSGTWVPADGQSIPLTTESIRLDELEQWTSPQSGAHYPSRWRLSSKPLDLVVNIDPLLSNQELITARSTRVTYWEGAVHVIGTLRGKPVAGQGYVELTGYAKRDEPAMMP